MSWASPGERAPWMPPLRFSVKTKSREVRGLGTYSFLGLPEESLILQRDTRANEVQRSDTVHSSPEEKNKEMNRKEKNKNKGLTVHPSYSAAV